jgi:hypothetical protein
VRVPILLEDEGHFHGFHDALDDEKHNEPESCEIQLALGSQLTLLISTQAWKNCDVCGSRKRASFCSQCRDEGHGEVMRAPQAKCASALFDMLTNVTSKLALRLMPLPTECIDKRGAGAECPNQRESHSNCSLLGNHKDDARSDGIFRESS